MRGAYRSWAAISAAVAALTLGAAPAAHADAGAGARAGAGPDVAVIVEAQSAGAAAEAVVAAGGRVDLVLDIVDGVAAHVPSGSLAALEADPRLQVGPDATVHPTAAPGAAVAADGARDPQLAAIDLPPDWSADAGRGVGIALVDTGVADTPDLTGDRLVRGPDLSGEGDGIDHYGHGTFMAGLIAGDGHASTGTGAPHTGVAPGATLVSVKVAGVDGSTTVSRVVAGIGWVVTHRDTYGIRVLNLSFGVDAPVPYRFDPLSGAAEAAWASGITVVASAGNGGDGHVTSPGRDPYVVTVGATDTAGTASTGDDTVASWSGRDTFHHYAKPDVVAPGVSVVSLRAPGSTIDTSHPEGRVDDVYFRGSGTSMSTAVVSGAAALLVAHHPDATPDDVKGALVDGAVTIAGGARALDVQGADAAPARRGWWQHAPVAFDGLGRGLRDGMPWTASRWTASRWTASRWTASRWTASRWTASRWTASRWTDAEWAASRWTASRWTASRWTASRWTASRWTASRWTASRWTADAWPSEQWG